MSKMDLLKIIAKNAVTVATDSISTATMVGDGSYAISNLASAGLKSWSEIKEFTKQSNDALYSLQIETFLKTADLDKEQVEGFLVKNPENLRVGMETLKILEKTHLEKQAEFVGKAFKKYVQEKITSEELYRYIHVIEQLNRHILTQIEKDLNSLEEYYIAHGLTERRDELSVMNFISTSVFRSQVLQTLGFITEEPDHTPITLSGSIKPKMVYKRTSLYLKFYQDIIEEE